MPDVWSANVIHLKSALQGLGAKCGVEARVLKPRDPEWTCYADSDAWRGDVYIHRAEDLLFHTYYLSFAALLTIGGLFLGLLWGKYFWRRAGG